MEEIVSEDFPEAQASTTDADAPQSTWTDEDTEEEEDGTWEDLLKDGDEFPTDFSMDFEDPDWAVNESIDMKADGKEGSYVDSTRMFKLRRNLDQLDSFYRQKELNVLKAREELKACRLHLAELGEVRDDLETEIEKEIQAENSVAVFRLRARHKCLCVQLQEEEELEAHLGMVLQEHELELCEVEVELSRFLSLRQQVEQDEKNFNAQKQEKHNQRVQREKNIAKGARLRVLRAKNEQEKALREQAELDQRRRDQALLSQKKAAVFLKQTLNRMRQKESEREGKRKEQMKKRMEAAASLKANIAATQEKLCVRQVKEKARLQEQKEHENHQKETLQAAGVNSIRLMHLQKAQEDLHRKQEAFQERQKARRIEIVSKLLLEDEMKEKRQALLYQPTPPHVTQSSALKQREQRLLQSILPPSTPAEREAGLTQRPASSRVSSRSDVSSSVDFIKDERSSKGSEAAEREGEEREYLFEPEFTGLWSRMHRDFTRTTDEHIPVKESNPWSMKTTLERSLASKAAKKTAGGKEFKKAFVSKPEMVLFKDFDVGKTYKKKIILTNVSHSTNYCRLLGVSQNLVDFISVSFEPPGPLSAGMACELEAVYKPLLNENLDGEIQLQSATGPFSVPIKCTVKRCEMVVDSRLIDFGTHVVGQTISRVITLTNRGALGTRFALAPHSTNRLPPQLSKHPSPTTQVPADSSSVKAAALNPVPEQIEPEVQSTACISSTEVQTDSPPTSCKDGFDAEATGADQSSEDKCLDLSFTGIGSQDHGSEVTEISIGEIHEGEVSPFSSVKLPVVFTPTIPGETKLDIQITFSQPECEAIMVSACGIAESVPVWVTKPSMDLRICMYDRLYQDSIEVQSRANTALKVTFEVCKEMKNHMDILPKTGFIQAKSSFRAQLKFLPRRSLPVDAKSLFDQDTGVLEVPLVIQVADQVRPVSFTVHAVVTTSDLEFDRTEVDFGHCSVFESVRTSVRLTNRSLLPQDFGFVGIPKFIDVQPNDGFGTLLPLQSLEIDLIFSASKAEEYNFQLTCKSGINRDFLLSCCAIGVRPLLELSDSLVEFCGTAVGDRSTAVLYVVNSYTSPNKFTHPAPRIGKNPIPPVGPRLFTFATPENSEITVSPASGRVLPGKRCLVQVSFSPLLSDEDIRAEAAQLLCRSEETRVLESQKANAPTANKTETQQETKKGRKSSSNHGSGKQAVKERGSKTSLTPKNDSPLQPPNPAEIQNGSDEYAAGKASLLRSFKERFSRYVIPCFVSNGDIMQQESEEPIYSPHNTLYLELHCPAIRPLLVVISNNGETTINFNQVILGQKVLKRVTVQNISSETVKLKSSLMGLNGPFSVQNAMREVRPGDTHTLLLAFTPASAKKYCEKLEVSCSKMALEFTLCGEGIKPLVTCSPEGGVMNFGDVLEKETTTQTFTLQNSSSVPVQFRVLLDSLSNHSISRSLPAFLSSHSTPHSTLGTQNYSGQSVFSVAPAEGAVGPGKTQDITVTFQPDHKSRHYRDTLRVQLLNKQTVCVKELRGAAWCHNMFVCGGDALDVCSESLIPNHIYNPAETEHTEGEKPPTPVLLTMRSVYGEGRMMAAMREIEVGCIRTSQPVAKKNVEFLWEKMEALQQHGFSVDPSKGSVEAGHRRTITVTWTPSAGHTPNEVIQVCVPLILRGDETEVYNVTLLAYTSHSKH
ncbi:cilia- and flagella-associated protein 74 isoform X1 [Astyanax mexicanus]|uniref:cilia- and flagella-associated protein 74 isoform X1 n=1 Tax=Astyanax mexicanus TaxID=7994 RepID=UPI0020CB3994|nr:cilia- and flagella-associated protein 74 isoform X1 [Astyanax mexicanus]XP_049341935.1 cilia- and flagella-associated protein 74 isoform X1 [Astyanax mexicanus]